MKPIVLVDCDGVLADFITPCLRVIESLTGTLHKHDDVDVWDFEKKFIGEALGKRSEYWRRITAEGFCEGLMPYAGAFTGMRRLQEVAEVYCVTSPMLAPTWADERRRWLAQHFKIDHKHIVSTAAKRLVRGHVFVDDKPEHCREWRDANVPGVPVLWAQHYNRLGAGICLRTRSWLDVIDIACRLGGES